MLVALAGGVGAARFLRGLSMAHPPGNLFVIGNTGDDLVVHGLHVSPDLDSVMYTLAGLADEERGWGLAGETWAVRDALARLGQPAWFNLGDADIATHLVRTRLLRAGWPLSRATAELCGRLGVQVRLVPMSDDRVETRVEVDGPGGTVLDLPFQEYWVQRRAADPVRAVTFSGAEAASPAPGVLDAIAAAEGILFCPSNPVVSIAPILAVPGIREAVAAAPCRTVAITPIIAGAPVRGMADKLLPSVGAEVSARGVAGLYTGLVDAFVLDSVDEAQAEDIAAMGMDPIVAPTLMTTPDHAAELAKTALEAL
jgi:LPPG:FO 2-phospho-L-lactate transferase